LFGLAAVGLIVLYVAWLKRRALDLADGEVAEAWPKQLMIIGSAIILVTLIPMVLAGREVNFELGMRSDHYTIQSAFGVGILLVGVFAATLKPALQVAVICFLIGISVMTHVQNATVGWRNWELQKQVWWQLTWRAPDLEEGTLLMVNMPPDFGYAEGYEAWAPANLIYSQGERIPPITGEVFNREFVFEVQHGSVAPKEHRGISVDRDFGKTLLLSLPQGNSCVNVIDGGKYELSALDDPLVEIAAPYSRIEQIELEAAPHQPPEAIFGPEPAHTWCYYYQKAMLARQLGGWEEIVRLGNEANAKKLNPQDRLEWMPFFEAYANTGQAQQAKRLAAIIKTEPGPRNMVCQQLYDRPPDYPGGYDYQSVIDYLCSK
jgi:hypothetical protein